MRRPALPVRLTTRTLLPAGAVITIAIFILAAVVVLDGRRDTERQAAQAARCRRRHGAGHRAQYRAV